MHHWPTSRPVLQLVVAVLIALLPPPAIPSVHAQQLVEIREIGPTNSNLHAQDADGASGGRVNRIAVARTNVQLMFAASEWGGLFRSRDAGLNWQHVSGHVPVATWDVKVDLTDANRVFATSFYDGRLQSRAGINLSTDGGETWSKPADAVPNEGFCDSEVLREEPSAFGIAIDPDNPANVFVGTNCGLAISGDRGTTWRFVNPGDGTGAVDVWSVLVHHGGIIDVCGADGHRRSTTGGASWTGATGTNQLPSGRCSLAVSPDEPNVLFAVSGNTIHETVDGGATWTAAEYVNPSPQGRIPFVAVNRRSGNAYDLWFGDVQLHRRTCTTPQNSTAPQASRCAAGTWAGPFTRSAGGHDDVGTILFDPAAAVDACPSMYSSDGGVYLNTVKSSPACHTPVWRQPVTTPRALWLWDLTAVRMPGARDEHIYFGSQDNGTFGVAQGGDDTPPWTNQQCCDGFNVAADEVRVLSIVCCWSGGRAARLWVSTPGMVTSAVEIQTYPPGNLRRFQQMDSLISFGLGKYAIITSAGIFATENVAASPIVWTQIGGGSTPPNVCGLQQSITPSTGRIVLYAKSGGCDGETGGSLWRHDGLAAGGAWKPVTRAGGGQFGVFAVDPRQPDRIIAADLGGTSPPEMVMSVNGGVAWTTMPALSAHMTGQGTFRAVTRRGPMRWTAFGAYPQPTLLAIDPQDSNTILAAAADAGVYLSRDGATSWTLLTDPNNPQGSGVPHIPRARYVHFDRDESNVLRLYIGTQGRGVWRVRVGPPFMPTSAPSASVPSAAAPAPASQQPDIAGQRAKQ